MIELLSLSIENFRSFYKAQTIDFSESSKRNITALYGPNATGKSNVIKALKTILTCIAHSSNASWRLPYEPFLLNTISREKPTRFGLRFRSNERYFDYRFSFDCEKIIEESLLERSKNSEKRKTIFLRNDKGELNSTAAKNKFGKRLIKKTRPDTLLVTKAREDNNEYANILFNLTDAISIVDDLDIPFRSAQCINLLRNDEALKNKTLELLNQYDFAIRDIIVRKAPFPDGVFDSLPLEIPQNIKNEMIEAGVTELKTVHAVRDNEGTVVGRIDFDFGSMESKGTQKFFDVVVPIIDALEKGKMLFIDEFSSYIHPNLAETIVNMFREQAAKRQPAKLIIITHNTAMMSDLHRDEMFLVEKTLGEETRIISLRDAGARESDAFEKRYRAGYYGGVPMIKS